MVYSSLKKLLAKFPYFLKKSPDSNFYKSEYVFNEQFKGLYNDLIEVYESFHLNKRLLVWREQSDAYDYSINFVACFPYLKTVTCYKNDEVIYTESYEYSDEVDTFIYSYDGSSENIIPSDKFHIMVETWEEYTLSKGYPENDTPLNDIYDHDSSLDHFGELHNIPRKTYKIPHKLNDDLYYVYNGVVKLTDEDYAKLTINDIANKEEFQIFNKTQLITYYKNTEHPFNNQTTENDYYYMNRIIKFLQYYHKLPLPVIEIWKLYGLNPEDEKEISFINRERYLCKMFEENRHLSPNGEYDEGWKPQRWEHKDTLWCPVKPDIFFFANVNNASPVQGMDITFDYDFIDEFARKTETDYYIIPYFKTENGELHRYDDEFCQYTKDKGFLWTINTNDIPGIDTDYQFDFIFRAYENYNDMKALNTNYLESDVIRITIKGCGNADIYVDCVDGNDNNDGATSQTAYRTLEYAVSQMHGSRNVIALINKNERFYIDNVLKIDETCSIISCPSGAVIYQNNGWSLFNVMQDTNLYLQGITLKHKCCEMLSESTEFVNENAFNYPINIEIPKSICKIATKIDMTKDYTTYAHRNITLTGTLLTDTGDYMVGAEYVSGLTKNCPTQTHDPNKPVSNEEVKLYLGSNLLGTVTTAEDGDYTFTQLFDNIGTFNIAVKHDESKKYCLSENYYSVIVEPMPTTTTITKPVSKMYIEESFSIPYSVKDYYDTPVTVGVLKLYEDNKLVKTVNNGSDLNYTPTVAGLHNYKIVFSHDETYVESSVEFTVNVVKYKTNLVLLSEGKSVYKTDENITITGVLTDELGNLLSNKPIKIYCDDTLLTTKNTDSKGEISYSTKLAKGNHTLHLEFVETSKYYQSISNYYRVRVRDTEIADIQLKLYPEHKILGSLPTSIPINVYACDKNGNPLSTSFKIADTYNSKCGLTDSTVYTTNNDGWWSGNFNTQAIKNCKGTYIQAISTVDGDVYSNLVHLRNSVEPELNVESFLTVDKSVYSYNNEVITVNGVLIDQEDDPLPNENLVIKVYAENTLIKTFNLTTDVTGEFEAIYTTTSNVRGKDLRFELTYAKHTGAYAACSDEVTVMFKQLATTISSEDLSVPTSQRFAITGSVIDENNIPADTGSVTITVDNTNYNVALSSNGEFSLSLNKLFKPSDYSININYAENTYYKTSNKETTLTITKLTPVITLEKNHLLVVDESYNLPYTFELPNISSKTSETITPSGTISLQKTNGTVIQTVTVKQAINLLFTSQEVIQGKLVYSGDDYLNKVTITGIKLTIVNPSYIIKDKTDSPWDITLLDEFPSDTSSYSEEDYLILSELLDDDNPKLILTDNPDESSVTGEEDIILVDDDDAEDVILENED